MLRPRPWSAPACRGAGCRRRWRPACGSTSTFGDVARGAGEVLVDLGAGDDQRASDAELAEAGARAWPSWRSASVAAVDHDQLAVGRLGRQRAAQAELAHLLRQVDGVAAHDRAEGLAAAAELRRAPRCRDGRGRCPSACTSSWSCRRPRCGPWSCACRRGAWPAASDDAALQDVVADAATPNTASASSISPALLAVEGLDAIFMALVLQPAGVGSRRLGRRSCGSLAQAGRVRRILGAGALDRVLARMT